MAPESKGGPKFPIKIRYEYKADKNCPMIYAHGVWGGVNPHGEIEMNLYAESDKLPDFSERTINPDGSVGPEFALFDEETKTITRKIQAKVIISHQTARAVIEWLEEKVEAMEMDANPGGFLLDDENGPAQ